MPEIDDEIHGLMEETRAQIARGEMVPPKVDWWWEGRRENEQTPDYLGRVLDELGLTAMAERARMAHYDDYHAPADVADGLEMIRLVRDLRREAQAAPDREQQIAAVENAVRHGEFDATKAESDRWAASKDGQETFAALVSQGTRPARVGRNDPCPCGSGLKFKRCHGA